MSPRWAYHHPVNDAPVAAGDAYTADRGHDTYHRGGPGVLANDSDADGDPLTRGPGDRPGPRDAQLNAAGAFTYTPAANFNGADSFTYKANDGTVNSNVATVALTITTVNDAPVAVNDAYTTAEDTALIIAAPRGPGERQ